MTLRKDATAARAATGDGVEPADARDLIDPRSMALILHCWGPHVTVAGAQLLADRLSHVVRLRLDSQGTAPETIVLKQMVRQRIGENAPLRNNPFFVVEAVTQRFLAEIRAETGLKPTLYAVDHLGAMIMEDLGPTNYVRTPAYIEVVPPMAAAFARLHERSRPHLDHCRRLLSSVGLNDAAPDRRESSSGSQAGEFWMAADFFIGDLDAPAPAVEEIRRELDEISRLIEQPGPFVTLIHDDVAHGRQTFQRNGQILLIDYEHARIGHALIDLSG